MIRSRIRMSRSNSRGEKNGGLTNSIVAFLCSHLVEYEVPCAVSALPRAECGRIPLNISVLNTNDPTLRV